MTEVEEKEVEQTGVEEDEENKPLELWQQVPAEIWNKIFQQLHSPLNPKPSALRRTVCKTWRGVIDEYLEFQVVLDDRKSNRAENMSHLRVTRCVVASLVTTKLSFNEPVFLNPTTLKELCLWGGITQTNFQVLVTQLPSVESISLTDFPLYSENLLVPPRGLEADFVRFYENLKKVTVTATSFHNLAEIFRLNLPNLEQFCLALPNIKYQTHEYRDMTKFTLDMFAFLARSNNLKDLNVRYGLFYGNCNGQNVTWIQDEMDFENSTNLLLDKQLETLRLAVKSQVIPSWISTVRAQRKLKDLRILVGEADRCDSRATEEARTRLFDSIIDTIKLNESTLSVLEMQNVSLNFNINAHMFANMTNLKRLVLRQLKILQQPHIYNLGDLPSSIQYVTFERLAVSTNDLMWMSDKLTELRIVQLLDLRDMEDRYDDLPALGINQYVIDSLCQKKKMKRLHITSLNVRRLACAGMDEEICLANNGALKLELQKQYWYPFIDYQFEDDNA